VEEISDKDVISEILLKFIKKTMKVHRKFTNL